MRHVGDLQTWLATRRTQMRAVAELADQPRAVRCKPRSPEKHAVLERAALAEIDRARASGRIERLGPRRYRLRAERQ